MKKRNSIMPSMSKIFIMAVLILIVQTAYSQSSQIHIVKRGQTFAVIASMYGLTESELREANPNAKNCYAGMKLKIIKNAPIINKLTETTSNSVSSISQRSSNKEVDNTPNTLLDLGRRYIEEEKYKKASKFLNDVLTYSSSTGQQKKEARELLAKIELAKEERREEVSSAIDNLAKGFTEAGNSLMTMGVMASQAELAQRRGHVMPNVVPAMPYNYPVYNSSSFYEYNAQQTISNLDRQSRELFKPVERELEKLDNYVKKSAETGKKRQEIIDRANACYDAGNYKEAFNLLKPLAEAGVTVAQYKIGDMYAEGKGVAKNETIANRWYRQAEESKRQTRELQKQIMEFNKNSTTTTLQSAPSVQNGQRVCGNCNGTGLVLYSNSCPLSKYTTSHYCIYINCQVCGRSHCKDNSSHINCPICEGTKMRPNY